MGVRIVEDGICENRATQYKPSPKG
uniref:Uncharacterized protein n=1 Tax=Amphimedon queenslandica TaxID=400682 RepID=A0A1X7UP92_AMPQE